MNKPIYIDIISDLLDDDEPVYALITRELISVKLANGESIEEKQKHVIRMIVIELCCQAVNNGDADIVWEYERKLPNIENALIELKKRHILAPINIYTFEQAPCYFYKKYSGDFVLKLTIKGEKLCSKYPV